MDKRYLKFFLYLSIILVAILFLIIGFYFVAIPILLFWYSIFGFVSIAHFFFVIKDIKKGKFFIRVTLPHFLLKPEKAYYYWLKASIISTEKKDFAEALVFAKKVEEEHLSTSNDMSMFNSYIACLYTQLGYHNEGLQHIEKAIKIDHKKLLDDNYHKIYEEIKQKLE